MGCPCSLVSQSHLSTDRAHYCPFRGCTGDLVKLGVAKRHGAVLGDAICLNSSLPCVLVDVVRCKMGKFSCCVPGCTNNRRNSPEKKFHTLPSDAKVRRLYEKFIRTLLHLCRTAIVSIQPQYKILLVQATQHLEYRFQLAEISCFRPPFQKLLPPKQPHDALRHLT